MGAAEVEGLPSDAGLLTKDPAELPNDLVFVDLETTGGNAAFDRITDIGIVRVVNGELAEEWSSLVNPERPIPPYIQSFTGISNEMVAAAPRFADIAPVVLGKLQGAVFVAHNARFDYSFLRGEFLRLGTRFSAQVLCTVKLSRRLFPGFVHHNLDAVMERHGLSCSARHRALGDARVLHDFWAELRREVPHTALSAAVRTLLGAQRLPAHLPPDLADDLPEGPGVYRYFGEGDALLYVGKSHSLRTRVLAQLTGGESGAQRLAALVRRVDWVPTAGELGAMLREAEWIKTLKPLRNRRPKNEEGSFTLRPAADPAGRVEPVPINGVDALDLERCFGVFHSEKDACKALADIARAQQLCLKILGLEDGAGACAAFPAGKCRGACVGKEPLLMHKLRLQLALSSLKLKSWPFPGRIALCEPGPRGNAWNGTPGADLHVVDHWTYLGTARSGEELAVLRAKETRAFDVDVYRILVRYFANHPKLNWRDLTEKTACS